MGLDQEQRFTTVWSLSREKKKLQAKRYYIYNVKS